MIPLSLYIHIPWCIKKCPYCDFNSHTAAQEIPEKKYIEALLEDLEDILLEVNTRPIQSIFIGGGTPSLFSAEAYSLLFAGLRSQLNFSENIEITLEANPSSIESGRFKEYHNIGINRLSIGIQSFNDRFLKTLGRVHDAKGAHLAIDAAKKAGFTNMNLDLMYGLPNQTPEEGLEDLIRALQHDTPHLSWYQLTIEPNTVFFKQQPKLPDEDYIEILEQQGIATLQLKNLHRYEISAYSNPLFESQHNVNYWTFGDYIGIGAGAHGKITDEHNQIIYRTQKHRLPKDYLDAEKPFLIQKNNLSQNDILFEFMLNATRLETPISMALFEQRTFLPRSLLMEKLSIAIEKNLVEYHEDSWTITPLGRRFTNDLQALFLEN